MVCGVNLALGLTLAISCHPAHPKGLLPDCPSLDALSYTGPPLPPVSSNTVMAVTLSPRPSFPPCLCLGAGDPGGTVSLFEAGPMEDQVSQVGQAGASACWGRDHGFQIFNSPRLDSLPRDPCCVAIVMAWEPRPPSQTEPGLPAPGA